MVQFSAKSHKLAGRLLLLAIRCRNGSYSLLHVDGRIRVHWKYCKDVEAKKGEGKQTRCCVLLNFFDPIIEEGIFQYLYKSS